MEYKGVLRVDLNSEEFCFQDLSNDKIFTNSKGQPLTLKKSVLFDEDNAYIDNPNEGILNSLHGRPQIRGIYRLFEGRR